MDLLFKTFVFFVFLLLCKEGECSKVWSLDPNVDVCAGQMPKLRVKISGEHEDDVNVRWRYKNENVKNGGHYGIGYGGIYLVVYDALPVHSGWYHATVYRKNDGHKLGETQFLLTVREVYLKLLVPDTVRIMRTTSTILKVEKSELGFLSWTHDGKDVYGKEPGLNFLNPSKTQLQISNARAEHGGKYEVALREGECKLQKEINLDIIGNFKLSSLNSVDDVCVGGNASFKIDLTGDLYRLKYYWGQQHSYLPKNEHFEEKADGKILNIINASANHSGVYTFYVITEMWNLVQSISFELKVRDLYLNTSVKSPVIVQVGDNTILKVEKSDLGTLDWKHNGNLLSGGGPHHTFLTPRKTELEISNAGPEQAGVYEVFLKEGRCVKRKEIRVQTGEIKIWSTNSHLDICVGEKASFAVEVNSNFHGYDFHVIWSHNMVPEVHENEHFSLRMNNTALYVHNALPSHSGNYTAFAVLMQNGSPVDSVYSFTSVFLRVGDVSLNTSVENPIKIKAGDSAMLKVEKSDLGALFWTHGEELVNDKDPHYTFLNADKTELEIVTASPEQAGIYEILLKEGGCEIRKIIEVQLYGEEDSEFWAITNIFLVYIEIFLGFFFREWYIIPVAGVGLVLLIVVLVKNYGRLRKKEKRHQEVEEEPPRKHLVLQKPIYSIQNDLIYTSANQAYPSYADDLSINNTYANMNSRVPSSALSLYGHGPNYSGITPAQDSLTGPTVPPPTQEFLETETSTEGSDSYSDL